ncbi:MAG: hypothetical protein QNJ54_29575 [Prochloraceae cyanobacterium]|nr:hypothetical protein [Prochloraceae cyanobacterium]
MARQTIRSVFAPQDFNPGDEITITTSQEVERQQNEPGASSLTLRLHYQSNELQFVDPVEFLGGLQGVVLDRDETVDDGNPNTDRELQVSYALLQAFPDAQTDLFNARFEVSDPFDGTTEVVTTGVESTGFDPLNLITPTLTIESTDGPIAPDDLDTQIYRFESRITPGTFLFVGEAERRSVLQNFADQFRQQGEAFLAADAPGTGLIRINRFQSTNRLGTYFYAGEAESVSVRQNPNWDEEGIAFYVYGADSGIGTTFNRFKDSSGQHTGLLAGPDETNNILQNVPGFQSEGPAFNVGI